MNFMKLNQPSIIAPVVNGGIASRLSLALLLPLAFASSTGCQSPFEKKSLSEVAGDSTATLTSSSSDTSTLTSTLSSTFSSSTAGSPSAATPVATTTPPPIDFVMGNPPQSDSTLVSSLVGSGSSATLAAGTSGDAASTPALEPELEAVSVAPITYSVRQPTHGYSWYGSHEVNKRTLEVDHNAEEMLCSRDAGVTFESCGGAHEVIFTPGDYLAKAKILVQLRKKWASDVTFDYEPATAHPGLTFTTCTTVLNGPTYTDVEFEKLVSGGSPGAEYVICLSPGVTVNAGNTTGAIDLSAANLMILGAESNPPTLTNLVLQSDGATDTVKLLHLNLAGIGSRVGVAIYGTSHKILKKVAITSSGNSGIRLYSGTGYAKLTLSDSTVEATAVSNGTASALYSDSKYSSALIENSRLSSADLWADAIFWYNYGGNLTVRGSVIKSTSQYYGAIYVHQTQTVTLEDSTIVTQNYGATVNVTSTLNLKNNAFIHLATGDNASNANDAVIRLAQASNTLNNTSTISTGGAVGSNNVACNQASAGVNAFSQWVYGSFAGSFSAESTLNGAHTSAAIGKCSTIGINIP